jgi:hypothetical protein
LQKYFFYKLRANPGARIDKCLNHTGTVCFKMSN